MGTVPLSRHLLALDLGSHMHSFLTCKGVGLDFVISLDNDVLWEFSCRILFSNTAVLFPQRVTSLSTAASFAFRPSTKTSLAASSLGPTYYRVVEACGHFQGQNIVQLPCPDIFVGTSHNKLDEIYMKHDLTYTWS